MSLARDPLPSELDALRAFAAGLQAELARKEFEIAANAAEIHAKTLHIEKLKMQLAVLRRARFGRSSEKLEQDIEQLELLIGELETDEAEGHARGDPAPPDPTKPRERRHPVRRPLPPHLPREVVTHEPACACPGCGSTKLSRIGQDEREVLEYVPSSFKVIRHVRPKLSCRACETVVQMPMPSLPIERGLPGPGLLAHVLIAKFCDHTPLHRQSGIYAREGVELDRATLADWVGSAVFLLRPLAEAIGRHVRAGVTLHADDTPVPVLSPGLGKTKTGRLWVLVRDERPLEIGRRAGRVLPLLGRPERLARRGAARGLPGVPACRRLCRVRQALPASDTDRRPGAGRGRVLEPCAAQVLRRTPGHRVADRVGGAATDRGAVRLGSEIRGQPPDPRAAARLERARPLLDELRAFLDVSLSRISGKSALAQAIRYTLSRWTALSRYVDDGRLEMSNNAAERSIRPLALGRKNYLFCGSDAGGERAACLYTIIETAKMSGINPEIYLTDILARIADHPSQKIGDLLPWRWKPITTTVPETAAAIR